MALRIEKSQLVWLALTLIVFGVMMRLLPHPANIAPVGAIALFGGAVLPRKLAWWLPVAVMVFSDYFLGFYSSIAFTWLGFLLVGLWGMALRDISNWFRIPLGAAGGAIIFFVVSNFGVWLQSGMYPHTWAGLTDCYAMALPFFRNTLTGDLIYSSLLFGLYAFASHLATRSELRTTDI